MDWQPGDVAACWHPSPTGVVISACTSSILGPPGLRWSPCHVAIACEVQNLGLVWLESTTLSPRPCQLAGGFVNGVQVHEINDRVMDYCSSGGRVGRYRLHPVWQLGTDDRLQLAETAGKFLAEHAGYDLRGAAISGPRLLQLAKLIPADLRTVFCSELVAAMLQRVGRMGHRNPARYSPGRLMRELVRTGRYQLSKVYQ